MRISSRREFKGGCSPKHKPSLKKIFVPSQASLGDIDSPLIHVNEIEEVDIKVQKSEKWLQFQKFELLHYLQKILLNLYIFLKLRKDTALVPIVLQKLLAFNEFIRQTDLIRTQKLIQIACQTFILTGNAYFELGSMTSAIPFYQNSLLISLQLGVFPLLEDKEKNKVKVENPKFQENLVYNLQLAIVSLDHLSQASEYISNYEMALNSLSFSEFLCTFLYYLRIGRELTSYILARHEYVFNHYGDFLYEKWELLKLTETIYGVSRGFQDSRIQFYEKKSLSEQLQESVFFKYLTDHRDKYILVGRTSPKREWRSHQGSQGSSWFDEGQVWQSDQRRVLSPFQSKVRMMLKVESPPGSPRAQENGDNTTIQSTKLGVSKNASMTDLIQLDLRPSSGLASLSVTQQRLFSPTSQNSHKSVRAFKTRKHMKLRHPKNEKTNYITELIRMENENLSDKQMVWAEKEDAVPEEVRREQQQQSRGEREMWRTLDQEMNQMIDEKMTSQLKLVNYQKAVADCQRLYKSHRDLKKEVPLTRGILGFRKEYGNGVAIIPESVEDVRNIS